MNLPKHKYSIHFLLVCFWIVICIWQIVEYRDSVQMSKDALLTQAKNVSQTIGIVLRAQSRFNVIRKRRIQASLDELIKSDIIKGITVLDMQGEVVAEAGNSPALSSIGDKQLVWQDDVMLISHVLRLHDGPLRLEKNTLVAAPRHKGKWWMRRMGWHEQLSAFSKFGMSKGSGYMKMLKSLIPDDKLKQIIDSYGLHRFVFAVSTDTLDRELQGHLQKCTVVIVFALFAVIAGIGSFVGLQHSGKLQLNLVKAREMNKHLREMNTAAAGLAHEIRNPMNVVKGTAQLIAKDDELPSETRGLCENIAAETEKMTFKLNEFISYSRPYEPKIVPVSADAIISNVVSALSIDCDEKDISVEKKIEDVKIKADPDLFKQMIFNIALNGVQAVNLQGEIVVSLTIDDDKALLVIEDDGPGVKPIQQEEIFNPYVTYSGQGTGLGLSIARQIAHNHNWEIGYNTSELGGARFSIGNIIVV